MSYTKRELRNPDRALLRRIQRQMDVEREKSPIFATEDFQILREAENLLVNQEKEKNTRLGLYNSRSKGRWKEF